MSTLAAQIESQFPFTPTAGQRQVCQLLADFLPSTAPQATFLLRGYAGTGKTTTVSALSRMLRQAGYRSELLAPTGRAAKVMAQYAERRAFTIHRRIYQQTADPHSGSLHFVRQRNSVKKTVFIVDEASMLSDESGYGSQGLLADLVSFVFEDASNKLLIIGDAAQLPPVGQALSPALDAERLRGSFGLTVTEYELTEVVRQHKESGILRNATHLRDQLRRATTEVCFQTRGYGDIFRMTGERLLDGLNYAYDKFGPEHTIVVCRSNKAAVQYNQHIRQQVLGREEELDAGDLLMIVRNNYRVLGDDDRAGFLANGDFAEVQRVLDYEDMHGFRFATVSLRLPDYPDQPAFETKVVLDTLHSHTPALTSDDNRKLYEAVARDYLDLPDRAEQQYFIRIDPYLNALQVKYAYALTCHKAQGGQWPAVFVDQGFLKDDQVDVEYLRWLYTAVTRATDELFLVNFHPRFFGSAAVD